MPARLRSGGRMTDSETSPAVVTLARLEAAGAILDVNRGKENADMEVKSWACPLQC
jgi:hypothetical protein